MQSIYLSLNKPKKSGFTIVELLIVVLVIGILSTLGYVSYRSISNNAKDTSLAAEATNLGDIVKSNQSRTISSTLLQKTSAGALPTTTAEALEANKLTVLKDKICTELYADDEEIHVADSCVPELTEGVKPIYDQTKIYLLLGYSGDYQYIRYGYWNIAQQKWIAHFMGTYSWYSQVEETDYVFSCSPFDGDGIFDSQCVVVPGGPAS